MEHQSPHAGVEWSAGARLATLGWSELDFTSAALHVHAEVLLQQPEKRLLTVGAKDAAEALLRQLRIDDHELASVVPVELADDLSQRDLVEFEPSLLPGEFALDSGRGERHHRGHRRVRPPFGG